MTILSRIRQGAKRLVLGPAKPPAPTAIDRGHLTMGRHSYDPPRVHHYRSNDVVVRIGNFSSIALDVEFLTGGNHHMEWVSTFPFRIQMGLDGAFEDGTPWTRGDVEVGNDVWIGRGAKVLSGVVIGDGAVVAAYSVVTKDVEPYAFVAGVPASLKRYRFPADTREALLQIAWWDWPDELIRERVSDLSSPDVQEFVRKYG